LQEASALLQLLNVLLVLAFACMSACISVENLCLRFLQVCSTPIEQHNDECIESTKHYTT
jgi:hypothetical protein